MGINEQAVLKTLLYADIFTYPLTEDEIWKYIAEQPLSKQAVHTALLKLKSLVTKKNSFITLAGRESSIPLRQERSKIAKEKYTHALRAARILSFIPTILLVGLSGSAAMDNADWEDDIDFFIITKHNMLWITRLLTILLLDILGIRRKHASKKRNGICINIFLDEADLAFSKRQQDIYSAHEIVQMKPLVNRNTTYQRFIYANTWIMPILPHALLYEDYYARQLSVKHIETTFVLENIAMIVQLWYMRKRKTSEITTPSRAFFHPFDHRLFVLSEFRKRLKIYDI